MPNFIREAMQSHNFYIISQSCSLFVAIIKQHKHNDTWSVLHSQRRNRSREFYNLLYFYFLITQPSSLH